MPQFHRAAVVRRLPHPGRGFTQGLITVGGTVWESSGGYGTSELRRYRPGLGRVEASAPLPAALFGEGICRAGDHLWQLTWRERVALRWDPGAMTVARTLDYNREGWGICRAGERMLTSDGSSELVWREPDALRPLGTVGVRCEGRRVGDLNDLDWAGGRAWACILGRPVLAGIDPATGEVTDIVDARPVRERHWGDPQAVLNGVAAMPAPGEFLLTGKGWRWIYHVRLIPARRNHRPERMLFGGG